MHHHHQATNPQEPVLAETQLEERDGAEWVSGICPACWERVAFPAPERGVVGHVLCPNGHSLEIVDQTSAGSGEWLHH